MQLLTNSNTFSDWFNAKFSMEATLRGVPWGTCSSPRPLYSDVWPPDEDLFAFLSFVVEHDLKISNWNHLMFVHVC